MCLVGMSSGLSVHRKRKNRSIVALVLLIAFCLVNQPASAKYGGGTGEPDDPYLIYTAEQMNEIGINSSDLDKHFKLMADIDLSSLATAFNVIGMASRKQFSGVFDGNGYVVSNFEWNTPSTNHIGLFGYVRGENAQIKNLRLINPVIDAETEKAVGSLIGYLHSGIITNCSVEGGFVSGNKRVGGLIGINSNLGLITNCFSTATVSGTIEVGGLVGINYGKITNCYSAGSVSGNEMVGGLVGHGYNEYTIINCYSTGSVSGSNKVGGLVGENLNSISTRRSFWDIESSG